MVRWLDARYGCIFTVNVLMFANLKSVGGRVKLTRIPPRRIEAFAGETVKIPWNYTVDDKNLDFGHFSSSPVWSYVRPSDGTKTVIAVDDGLHNWRWTISRRTCPPRLLYPTVRIRKESVATLVISNVNANDSGWYEISLAQRTSASITDKAELVVTDNLARFTKVPPTTVFVAKEKTARLEWNYTYNNRNIEFHPESPVWAFIDQKGYWATIATAKKDQVWSAVINKTTCPARLLNPLRVSIEQPATLVISNVTEADNGKYGCMLRLRKDLPINSTTTLVVTDNPKVFVSTLRTKIVQDGSDVTINCSATGSPIPDVTWVKVEEEKHFVGPKAKERSLLEIKNINKNQGGTYECQATNNPNELPVTTRLDIVVMYFKEFSTLKKNGEAQIVEGENLNITCELSPPWPANITWVSKPVHETSKLNYYESHGETLAIKNISRSQQGNYQCQAYDKGDGILGLANVFIRVMYKPEIDKMLSDKLTWFGETILLRCVARGVPVPNVTWYGVNGRIIMNGTSESLGSSTLTLKSPDNGIYRCLASNRYGIAWYNVTVTHSCPCKLIQSKKKNSNDKKLRKQTKLFDFTASIVLLALSVVSILINVLLCLILVCKVYKGKNQRHIKVSKGKNITVKFMTSTAGQAVCDDSNPEPPMAAQSESTALNTNKAVHGKVGYEDISSASLSSLRDYEHLDPINRQKGFQTFGNHQQSTYEQLHHHTSFPVYQRLNNSDDRRD